MGTTAEVNGTTLAYVDHGSGVPVVMSHSLFFDLQMFGPLDALLTSTGYRCIRYDHRGQGASASATGREELSVDTLARDAAALITHLDVAPCHFVGNSLGGMVGLRLSARRPELLRSVVVLGASAEAEDELRYSQYGPLIDRLASDGPVSNSDVHALVEIMFGDTSVARDSEMIRYWRTYMSGLPARISLAARAVIDRASVVDELRRCCGVPVLAVGGAQDHAYPPPISTTTIAEATGGVCAVVQAAGHSIALEQPGVTAELLVKHFRSVEAVEQARQDGARL